MHQNFIFPLYMKNFIIQKSFRPTTSDNRVLTVYDEKNAAVAVDPQVDMNNISIYFLKI